MTHINENELVYNVDKEGNIFSGGFGVNNILMKMGGSPIITLNGRQTGGGEKVSDLFNDLAVPNWATSYREQHGVNNGETDMEQNTYRNLHWANYDDDVVNDDTVRNKHIYIDSDSEYDDDYDEDANIAQSGGNIITDDLYNKLLGLVTVDRNGNENKPIKKKTRRLFNNKNKNKNKNTNANKNTKRQKK
jgi:hypothetical protein